MPASNESVGDSASNPRRGIIKSVADGIANGSLLPLPRNPVLFEKVNFGVIWLAPHTPSPAAQLLMELIEKLDVAPIGKSRTKRKK
jgi:hypothetical protein